MVQGEKMLYDDSKEAYLITLQPGESVDLLNWGGKLVKTKTNNMEFPILIDTEGYGFKKKDVQKEEL